MTLVNRVPGNFTIEANPDALTVVLSNLIDNAIIHGRSLGIVRISARLAGDDYAEINVNDDCDGIPDEARARLLRRCRLPESRGNGGGLGLAIVARIAELHGASITLCRSDLGGLRVRLRWSRREFALRKT